MAIWHGHTIQVCNHFPSILWYFTKVLGSIYDRIEVREEENGLLLQTIWEPLTPAPRMRPELPTSKVGPRILSLNCTSINRWLRICRDGKHSHRVHCSRAKSFLWWSFCFGELGICEIQLIKDLNLLIRRGTNSVNPAVPGGSQTPGSTCEYHGRMGREGSVPGCYAAAEPEPPEAQEKLRG